jgi:hypothetical protein
MAKLHLGFIGVLGAAVLSSGCFVSSDDGDDTVIVVDDATYVTIDSDALLETTLGEGAGMFVEYESGGLWRLWTSCDTALQGARCFWDAHVIARSALDYLGDAETHENNDYVDVYGADELVFHAVTDYDSDQIEFVTDPGALVEIDLGLDGYDSPDYLVWQGNGYVHHGAERSPVVFQPDLP